MLQVDRTQRWIDHDDNPTTATITNGGNPVAEGDATKPFYRDGFDDLFEKPYRGNMIAGLMGDEDGPDLVIDASAGGNQAAFLNTMNAALFGTYPSDVNIGTAADAKVRARIVRIEVYQPPLINLSGTWSRYGIATVRVTAGVFTNAADGNSSNDKEVARRVVRAVVNETPYPGPTGPLQTCEDLDVNGEIKAHWGKATAIGDVSLASNLDSKVNSSFPFAENSRDSHIYEDPMGAPGNSDLFDTWYANWQGQTMEDPWFRFEAGGQIDAYSTADIQPFPAELTTAPEDHSNIFHAMGSNAVGCPKFDYATWKQVAQNGGKNVLYLAYDAGSGTFTLDGLGDPKSFRTWTEGETGLFFFDTVDGQVPAADGSNLTPAVGINGGAWNSKGFIYLNAANLTTTGAGTPPNEWIFPPGEPFVDLDADGVHDAGEPHVNLEYDDDVFTVDNTATGTVTADTDGNGTDETYTTTTNHDVLGLPFETPINLYGVMYTSGQFDAEGNFAYYGSVVSQKAIGPSAGTPDFYFDPRLLTGNWPPPGIDLPRVIISRWDVEL